MAKEDEWQATKPAADYSNEELKATSIFTAMKASFPGHEDAVLLTLVRGAVDQHWELQRTTRVRDAVLKVFEVLGGAGEQVISPDGSVRPYRQAASPTKKQGAGTRFKLADYVKHIGEQIEPRTPPVKKQERKGTYTLRVEAPTPGTGKPVTLRLVQDLEQGSAPDIVFPRPPEAEDSDGVVYVNTATDVLRRSMLALPKSPAVYFGLA